MGFENIPAFVRSATSSRGHVEPLIPPAKRGGNKRHVDVRKVMNRICIF
jgi:hypothetical protein